MLSILGTLNNYVMVKFEPKLHLSLPYKQPLLFTFCRFVVWFHVMVCDAVVVQLYYHLCDKYMLTIVLCQNIYTEGKED